VSFPFTGQALVTEYNMSLCLVCATYPAAFFGYSLHRSTYRSGRAYTYSAAGREGQSCCKLSPNEVARTRPDLYAMDEDISQLYAD
jgi:hypothetical protein